MAAEERTNREKKKKEGHHLEQSRSFKASSLDASSGVVWGEWDEMTTRLCTALPRAGESEQQKKQQEKNREKKKKKDQRRQQSFKVLSLDAASEAV